MGKIIRIGTRESELALWQAKMVQAKLEALGHDTILVPITSTGDQVLDKPLYELGITGIFTKTLDIALLKGKIDIAVHSLKDVPTQLPKGIVQGAVLQRASPHDLLVHKGMDFLQNHEELATIATGSLRRKAQWLSKYPHHKLVNLRGNVNTRLIKLIENEWQGAIFAQAGLERIKLMPKDALVLDWMVPAPAQGAMVAVTLEKDSYCQEVLSQINHLPSEKETSIEREFLRVLEGGCTAPIGALAEIQENTVRFKGVLLSLDGTEKIEVEKSSELDKIEGFGKACAQQILDQGGTVLMQSIRNENSTIH